MTSYLVILLQYKIYNLIVFIIMVSIISHVLIIQLQFKGYSDLPWVKRRKFNFFLTFIIRSASSGAAPDVIFLKLDRSY